MNPTLPIITPQPSDTPQKVSSPKHNGTEISDSGSDKSFTTHLNKAVDQNNSNKSTDSTEPALDTSDAQGNIDDKSLTSTNDDTLSPIPTNTTAQTQQLVASVLTDKSTATPYTLNNKHLLPLHTHLTNKHLLPTSLKSPHSLNKTSSFHFKI